MLPEQQLFMNGFSGGQAGGAAESQGNFVAAAQCYDGAIMQVAQSIMTATQFGRPVPSNVYFVHCVLSFSAARVKNVLGQGMYAWGHLQQALYSINQALMIEPQCGQYHLAAGIVLAAQNNFAEALRAFQTALQINPRDLMAQQMLNSLQSMFQMQGPFVSGPPQAAAPWPTPPASGARPANETSGTFTADNVGRWVDAFTKVLNCVGQAQKTFGQALGGSSAPAQFGSMPWLDPGFSWQPDDFGAFMNWGPTNGF
jgi:tetratricopeptide (TPR) repeat protein